MLILFFDVQRMVMAEWVLYWENVDAAFYIKNNLEIKNLYLKEEAGLVAGEPVCAPPQQRSQPLS